MPRFMIYTSPNVSIYRGDEISGWLNECKEDCNYVIIDDLDIANFNTDQLDTLVVVNPFYGLNENIAQQAIDIINKQNLKQ